MGRSTVEVFAEIACPFTHVGLRRIVRRRERSGRAAPLLRVRAWPLEWVNGEPMEPSLVAQHVAELREQAEPEMFRKFDPSTVPSTSIPAFALVAVAASCNEALGEQVGLALRDALFEEGRDVSDPAVLHEIRTRFGLSPPNADARRAVEDEYAEGQRRGVRGSPEYFLDGLGYHCPSLRMEEIDGSLSVDRVEGSESFDRFLEACFGG